MNVNRFFFAAANMPSALAVEDVRVPVHVVTAFRSREQLREDFLFELNSNDFAEEIPEFDLAQGIAFQVKTATHWLPFF